MDARIPASIKEGPQINARNELGRTLRHSRDAPISLCNRRTTREIAGLRLSRPGRHLLAGALTVATSAVVEMVVALLPVAHEHRLTTLTPFIVLRTVIDIA
jgi:hypothetical protein